MCLFIQCHIIYINNINYIWISAEITKQSAIGNGVRYGCCISPSVFNIYMQEIIWKCLEGLKGKKIGVKRLQHFRFSNDMAV